ncbi:hypothetical protein V6N12_070039 [Hibiscus sabdariffa]|uniref:Uncharacterized protein n=1 Tax=Hibiscus sabdariffa TaxID=183260 RepID=A0ABR2FG68_9ROSI
MDASSKNDDNGHDASASDGPDSVHFGWNNDMVDKESYEAQEDSDVGSYKIDSYGDFVSRKTTKIRIVPKLRLVDMTRLGREELNVELNKQLCSRAMKWAEEKIKGNITHELNRLFDYVLASRSAEPNGSFGLVVERPTAANIPKFRRLYVCFGALKEEFKRSFWQRRCLDLPPCSFAYSMLLFPRPTGSVPSSQFKLPATMPRHLPCLQTTQISKANRFNAYVFTEGNTDTAGEAYGYGRKWLHQMKDYDKPVLMIS